MKQIPKFHAPLTAYQWHNIVQNSRMSANKLKRSAVTVSGKTPASSYEPFIYKKKKKKKKNLLFETFELNLIFLAMRPILYSLEQLPKKKSKHLKDLWYSSLNLLPLVYG